MLPFTGFGALIGNRRRGRLSLLVFLQVVWVTMVYGPIAAYLVEAFPARIRYTAMSLPYHIGNGVFGGLLPLIGLASLPAPATSTPASTIRLPLQELTFVVGSLLLKETHQEKIWTEVQG